MLCICVRRSSPPPPPSFPHICQQRAELNGRSIMNAGAGEAEAAKLLSNVMEARRQLEEDADAGGGVGEWGDRGVVIPAPSAVGLQSRLREAKALAQVCNFPDH